MSAARPGPASAPTRYAGVLALLAAATLWSLNGVLIKVLSADQMPGITIACLRSLIGGLVFLPLAWPRRHTLRNVGAAWPVGCVLMFTLMTATFVISNTMTTSANAIILQYTSPIWIFLLSPLLLRERPRRAEGAVLVVAMAGVAIIFAGHARDSLAALLVALTSGLGYGALTVALRGLRPVNAMVVAAMNALGSGVLLIAPTLIWGTFELTARQWGLVVLMGLVQFTLPYFLFTWALQRVEAHRAGMVVLLEVVLNPVWTFLAVSETPAASTLIGGPLVLAGVVGTLLLGRPRPPTPPRPSAGPGP